MPKAKRPVDIIAHHELFDLKLGKVHPEFRFDENRKWRFDFAIPQVRVALEIEGGIWRAGRHNRGKGMQGDMDKYNSALVLGWRVFRFSTEDVLTGRARKYLREWREANA